MDPTWREQKRPPSFLGMYKVPEHTEVSLEIMGCAPFPVWALTRMRPSHTVSTAATQPSPLLLRHRRTCRGRPLYSSVNVCSNQETSCSLISHPFIMNRTLVTPICFQFDTPYLNFHLLGLECSNYAYSKWKLILVNYNFISNTELFN